MNICMYLLKSKFLKYMLIIIYISYKIKYELNYIFIIYATL